MLTNYEKGRNKEYRIMSYFRKRDRDNIVIRTAGSHSPFDVVVINKRTRVISLIQSKLRGKENLSKPARQKILDEGNSYGGEYIAEFMLWE